MSAIQIFQVLFTTFREHVAYHKRRLENLYTK